MNVFAKRRNSDATSNPSPLRQRLPLRSRLARNPVVRILAGIACVALPLVASMMLVQALVPKEMRIAWHHLLAATLCLAGYRFYVRRFEQREAIEAALHGAAPGLLRGLGIGRRGPRAVRRVAAHAQPVAAGRRALRLELPVRRRARRAGFRPCFVRLAASTDVRPGMAQRRSLRRGRIAGCAGGLGCRSSMDAAQR